MTLNMFTELPIDMLFYIYFLIGSIIVLALGMVIAKKANDSKSGFSFVLLAGVGLFIWLLSWFNTASRESFMGKFPLMINLIFGSVLLVCFFLISRLIIKKYG